MHVQPYRGVLKLLRAGPDGH